MFDYTEAIQKVCRDICAKVSIFRSYNLDFVGFAFRKTRNDEQYGVFASLTPLRFEGGSRTTFKRGSYWTIPEVLNLEHKTPLLYILTIYVPRFWNLSANEKIGTLVHELYHIGPAFDGDLRRFAGRKFAHGSSRKKYDEIAAKYANDWLATDPDPALWNFLKWNADELYSRCDQVIGRRFPNVPMRKIGEAEARSLNVRR